MLWSGFAPESASLQKTVCPVLIKLAHVKDTSAGRELGMKRTLPPLNGLRAFEALARHMSFTGRRRRTERHPAAISHQVRGLEQRLGLKLFVRSNRSLLLSEAGQAYLPSVRAAFDQLNEATEKLLQKDRGGHLTVDHHAPRSP
jgi:hypothetical protein